MKNSYQRSRDAAWEMLLRHRVRTLPVDLIEICRREKIAVYTYAEAAEQLRALGLADRTAETDAFTFGGIIFYNARMPIGRQRFSIAHEIGHIVLHGDRLTLFNRGPRENDEPKEREANMFAARLLSPAIVLERIGVSSEAEIASLCEISAEAAKWRFQRLTELRERDKRFKSERGYSCFGLSPLERKLEKRFRKYIRTHIR